MRDANILHIYFFSKNNEICILYSNFFRSNNNFEHNLRDDKNKNMSQKLIMEYERIKVHNTPS